MCKIYYPSRSGMTKSDIHEFIEDEINSNEGWPDLYGEYDLSYLSDKICQYIVDELQRIQEVCDSEEEKSRRQTAFFKRLLTGWVE